MARKLITYNNLVFVSEEGLIFGGETFPAPGPTPPPPEPSYTVFGAGNTTWNGSYSYVGTLNGKDYWKHETETVYLYFGLVFEAGNSWILYTSLTDVSAFDNMYFKNGDVETPPLNKWSVGSGAVAPAPTVQEIIAG